MEKENAILFVPGGLYLGGYRPYVTMFQNMQIFETSEKNRENLNNINKLEKGGLSGKPIQEISPFYYSDFQVDKLA